MEPAKIGLAAAVGVGALCLALPACAAPPARSWRIDLSTAYSRLSAGQKPWRDTLAALTFRPNGSDWLSGSVEQATQFGLTDRVYGLSGVHTFGRGAYLGGGASLTPQAHFRPRSGLHVSGQTRPIASFGAQTSLSAAVEVTTARYRAGTVRSLQPALLLTGPAGSAFAAKLIETRDERGRTLSGYAFNAGAAVSRNLSLSAGFADAPESDAGVTIKTRSLSAAALIDLTSQLSLRVGAVQEWRPYFQRSEVSVGLVRTF